MCIYLDIKHDKSIESINGVNVLFLIAFFKDLPLLLGISNRSYSLDGDVTDIIDGDNGDA